MTFLRLPGGPWTIDWAAQLITKKLSEPMRPIGTPASHNKLGFMVRPGDHVKYSNSPGTICSVRHFQFRDWSGTLTQASLSPATLPQFGRGLLRVARKARHHHVHCATRSFEPSRPFFHTLELSDDYNLFCHFCGRIAYGVTGLSRVTSLRTPSNKFVLSGIRRGYSFRCVSAWCRVAGGALRSNCDALAAFSDDC